MRLKFVSDGTSNPRGARVETPDGEAIEGVRSVKWRREAAGRPIVTIELSICDVEINYSHSGEPLTRP